jgi:hypothetical protein
MSGYGDNASRLTRDNQKAAAQHSTMSRASRKHILKYHCGVIETAYIDGARQQDFQNTPG